jgi:hypothetical protein
VSLFGNGQDYCFIFRFFVFRFQQIGQSRSSRRWCDGATTTTTTTTTTPTRRRNAKQSTLLIQSKCTTPTTKNATILQSKNWQRRRRRCDDGQQHQCQSIERRCVAQLRIGARCRLSCIVRQNDRMIRIVRMLTLANNYADTPKAS